MRTNKDEWYVASPSGFSESTYLWYKQVLLPMLQKYITPIDPWASDVSHILKASPGSKNKLWLDLGEQFYKTIKQRAKGLVAILDQEPPDNGTVAEVVWAAANGIPVIGYRNDKRNNGEEGLSYNLMIGAAIRISNGKEVSSLAELETTLERYTAIANRA